jgi:ribosomal-protein-alanine N-acetyltransferase
VPLAQTLTSERLCLRPFSPADVPALYAILNEPGILEYYPPTTTPMDEERVGRIIQKQIIHWQTYGYGWWAVTAAEGGVLLGWCGLQFLPETAETEVGYLLTHSAWGKGYGSEAAAAAVEAGLGGLPVPEIIGLTHPQNIASQRVLQKAGLVYVGEFEYFGMYCKKYARRRAE